MGSGWADEKEIGSQNDGFCNSVPAFCFQLHVVELGPHQPGNAALLSARGTLPFKGAHTEDFPSALQVNLVAVLKQTKHHLRQAVHESICVSRLITQPQNYVHHAFSTFNSASWQCMFCPSKTK